MSDRIQELRGAYLQALLAADYAGWLAAVDDARNRVAAAEAAYYAAKADVAAANAACSAARTAAKAALEAAEKEVRGE